MIITDLDTVSGAGGAACKVADGTHTSNACIKTWFGDKTISPTVLLAAGNDKKVKGLNRIAFQLPETDAGPCGRSFEDAFVLANQPIFGLNLVGETEKAGEAWKKANEVEKKSDFALRFAIEQETGLCLGISKKDLVGFATRRRQHGRQSLPPMVRPW